MINEILKVIIQMEDFDKFVAKSEEWFKNIMETISEYANKLKKSEKWLSTTLSSIGDAVIATDRLGMVQFINPVAESLTGWRQEESVGKPLEAIFNIINEETRKSVENPVSRVIREGIVIGLANHTVLISKDGKEIPIADSGAPIKDDKGDIIGTVLIFRDISERKKREQALKESEERYRNLFEVSIEGIGVIKGVRFVTANKALLDIFRYDTVEEIQEIPIFEYVAPESKEEAIERFKKRERGEVRESRLELKIIRKDGELRDVELSSIDVFFGNEKYLQTAVRDITERKLAEEALRKSEEKFKFMFDFANDGILIADSESKILMANITMSNMLGYTQEEVNTLRIEDIHTKENLPYVLRQFQLLAEGKIQVSEINMIRKDGSVFPAEVKASPITLDGKVNIMGAFRNITERKKAEQAVKEALTHSEFYKDLLAHDMGNILNNIKSSAQLMEMWKDDPTKSDDKEEMMEIIKQQIERGSSLILNVRKLSEIEGGEQVTTSVDVKFTLENAIEYIRSRFQEKEIDIKTELPQGIINVKGGDLLLDAFENILLNGCIHNESGKIQLWINLSKVQEEGENFVKIEFKDNGIGIIEDRKKSIFERSYKKDRDTGGMGIGLSLMKKIIDGYNGQVWVENRVEGALTQGSNFIVMLIEAL